MNKRFVSNLIKTVAARRSVRIASSNTRAFSSLVSSSSYAATRINPQLQITRGFSTDNDFEDEDAGEYFGEEDAFIQYPFPQARIQQAAPRFSGKAVIDGEIKDISLNDYKGKYVVLFFYPKDFTYVCPTEIIAYSDRHKEFEDLNTQLIACSIDSAESHLAWTRVKRTEGGLGKMNIPMLSDLTKIISSKYGVLLEDKGIALRGTFIINPQGVLEQITINNLDFGRNVDETLRLLKAIQFAAEHGEVCPANWNPGDKTIIANPEDSIDYFASGATDTANEAIESKMVEVNSPKEFDAILKSGKPVVADFMAPWCGKCEQILPYVEELANTHSNVTFVKLDTTVPAVEELKKRYHVNALPAFRFFKNGKEVGTAVTGYKKSLLKAEVEKLD